MAATSETVSFDEFSKIRLLEPTQFDASQKLKDECKDFTQKINDFNQIVGSFQALLKEKSGQIEKEKLKSIGYRIKVDSEMERRKSRQAQLQSLIGERQAELDRLTVQYESLLKVQQEQALFIERLSLK